MLHQWDQRARADARQTGNIRVRDSLAPLSEIRGRDRDRLPRPVRQRHNHVHGTACLALRLHRKPVPKKEMMGIGDRDASHGPLKNRAALPCSANQPTLTPFLDRLVHNADRIDLKGESMLRTRKPGRKI